MVSRFLAGWEITLTLTQSEWERNRRSATVTLTRNRRSSTIDARSLALVRNLLAILMCLQVLVCPALCIDVCQLHEQANGPSSHLEGSVALTRVLRMNRTLPVIPRPNAAIAFAVVLLFRRPIRFTFRFTLLYQMLLRSHNVRLRRSTLTAFSLPSMWRTGR
jgi:hypothetical protein